MENSAKIKKILFVTRPICPPWDEASKNFAYQVAKNLTHSQIHLLTSGKLDNLPSNIIPHSIYSSNRFGLKQKWELFHYLRKNKNNFDLIHYFFTPTKLNSFLIKNFLQNKNVRSVQTIATLREDLFSDEEIRSLMFADMIVTYSQHSKDKLISLGLKNVEQIYPGIDLNSYTPASKDQVLLKELKIRPEDFVVVYPGEYTRLGNIDHLVDKIIQHSDRLVKNNLKFILAFRTKNEQDRMKKEAIKKRLEKHNLQDMVLLPETFVSLENVFNLADVVIFPVENMHGKFDVPLAVVEAMACAKPVIISDLPLLLEFAKNDISVKIKSGDMDELIEKILQVQAGKLDSAVIGKNARQFAENNFNIQTIAEKYENLYGKIIHRK
jgi:glycosyltransferase involved in cell wall biosynthesis